MGSEVAMQPTQTSSLCLCLTSAAIQTINNKQKKKKWLLILHIPAYLPWHFKMLLADFGQEQGIKEAEKGTELPQQMGTAGSGEEWV